MKTTSLLALPFALVLASMVASIGCSQPMLQPYDLEEEDEDDNSSASSKKKSSSKNKEKASTDESNDTAPPAPSGPVPPPPAEPPPPAPSDDPVACMDQCVAAGPAAQYWQCSETCQNIQCDDNCWFGSSCGQQEDACIQSLESCDQQCGFSASQGGGF